MGLTAKKVYAVLNRKIKKISGDVSSLGTPLFYAGSVTTADLLPVSPKLGAVYNIEQKSIYGESGTNVVWNGVLWDALGPTFDLSLLLTKENAKNLYLQKNQGSENSGKFLVVGEDGNVIPSDTQDGGVKTDTTLTKSGEAADAKVVGDKITTLKEDLTNLNTLVFGDNNPIVNVTEIEKKVNWENGYFNTDGSIHEPTGNKEMCSSYIQADDYDTISVTCSSTGQGGSSWVAISIKTGGSKVREVIIDNVNITSDTTSNAIIDCSKYKGKELAFCYRRSYDGLINIRLVGTKTTSPKNPGMISKMDTLEKKIANTQVSIDSVDKKIFEKTNIDTIIHGATTVYPSNTLGLYKRAYMNGITNWECDIVNCTDDYVLCHDNDIYNHALTESGESIQENTVLITNTSLEELKKYKFGIITGNQSDGLVNGFENERIPTLREFLMLAKACGATPFVEIKFYPTLTHMTNVMNIIKECNMLDDAVIIAYSGGENVAKWCCQNGLKNISLIVQNGASTREAIDIADSWISQYRQQLKSVYFSPSLGNVNLESTIYAASKNMLMCTWTVPAGWHITNIMRLYNAGCSAFTSNWDNVSTRIKEYMLDN